MCVLFNLVSVLFTMKQLYYFSSRFVNASLSVTGLVCIPPRATHTNIRTLSASARIRSIVMASIMPD